MFLIWVLAPIRSSRFHSFGTIGASDHNMIGFEVLCKSVLKRKDLVPNCICNKGYYVRGISNFISEPDLQ